MFKIADCGAI